MTAHGTGSGDADADVLRRAAAAMRLNARFATRGPWAVENRVVLIAVDECRTILGHCNQGGIPENESNAIHIASWHPLVAVAVADLLDNEAHAMEPAPPYNGARRSLLTAVARAYLEGPAP